ncbi:hypothetical protein SAMN05444398_1224 [Roseovarius pacificus]|uniref:Uncharacterized protein n=1 Tax=Roseovarius pacificus TaxID=337701 RepID=A0A1M7JRX5_9RHOB|nr:MULTISPECIES: hypothetical protein [Roseovarius]MBU3262204.1 hypothetical protein [Roseovarius sp. PS-C2]GGO62207.1 hypothetical protein GCM10011315_40670 [Roseovarius pacificus]SHM55792.1 hypothetical protein SAMN05444398_1224 [Roseovarius pacificus]
MPDLEPDTVIVIRAFDDVPEHLFEVHSVEDDRVTGVALSGPFAGTYGEPPLDLVKAVVGKD